MSSGMSARRVILHVLLGALLVGAVTSCFVALHRRADIGGLGGGGTSVDDIHVGDLLGSRTGWVVGVVAVLHAIAFGSFFHRAYKVLSGRVAVEGDAKVAAASFFIPIFNLWLPVQAATRLLAAVRREATGLILAWWIPFTGGIVLRRLSGSLFDGAIDDADLDGARTALLVDAVGSLAIAGSAVVAVLVVARIAEGVEARLAPSP